MNLQTHRLLIVEDDPLIADAICARLRSEGFQTTHVTNGIAALEHCVQNHPDLVVLDLGLPGELDGVEVCRRLQAQAPIAVVMLTARDDETDLLIGLGVGADDYLTKPFSHRELVARIRAVLRRSASSPGPLLQFGSVSLDPAARTVRNEGSEVHLTATEFDLLATLARHGGAVLSREQLLDRVWGHTDMSGARTVDSHVRSIRRKLGDGTVRTAHGVGYAIGSANSGVDQ